MGFWDFNWLPWVDDDPKPAPRPITPPAQQRDWVERNVSRPNSTYTPPPPPWSVARGQTSSIPKSDTQPGTVNGYRLPTRNPLYSPQRSTRETRRYLRAAGWNLPQEEKYRDPLRDKANPDAYRPFGTQHTYSLSPWQQEQAGLYYDVEAPEERIPLKGEMWQVGELTPEAYEAMTPQQRNAIKFNELLLAAVEADQKAARPDNTVEYDRSVREMFGTQGGSQMYAPNTMTLLEKMGMGKLRGQDLDEYLSLDRAFDAQELSDLRHWEETPELPEYKDFGDARSLENAALLDRRQIDMAGNLLSKVNADKSIIGWDEQSRIDAYLGKKRTEAETPIGWYLVDEPVRPTEEASKMEAFYQNAYDFLADPATTSLDELYLNGDELKFTESDYDELFQYFYLRSLEDDRIGPQEGRRTGAEIRQLAGIGD